MKTPGNEMQQFSENEDDVSRYSDSSNSDQEEESIETVSNNVKKRTKHKPAESSSKTPVSWIRQVPGLESKKPNSHLYKDIRFDAAFGKADLEKTRKNYAFLDEYRQKELADMRQELKQTTNEEAQEELKAEMKQLRDRLKTLKERDFEHKVLSDFKKQAKGKYYLKGSEKKKLLLTEKFKQMGKGKVNKSIERKRKREIGKEKKLLDLQRRA